MRVAFITGYDSANIKNWSGLGFHIANSLESQGIELIRVNCFVPFSRVQKILKKLAAVCFRKTWQLEREHHYLQKMAGVVTQQLAGREYDCIFSAGSLPVSFLETHKPIVFFTDATYDGLMQLYVNPARILGRSIRRGNQAEYRAIQKASLIFYTSDWAKQSAEAVYLAAPEKIRRLHFGANLRAGRTVDDIAILINQRWQHNTKNFLFVGVDWKRKGADTAIQTVLQLNRAGIASTLTIVGAEAPKNTGLPGFVTHYPFISKATEEGSNQLDQLFKRADFFLLPTEADCTPVVFSEAASYGLPVITTAVGGCPSVVTDNVNGFCINKKDFVTEAVKRITPFCLDRESYESLCFSSFHRYEKELNWDVIAQKVKTNLQHLLKDQDLAVTGQACIQTR
jgi:glycosyltransferase involved in cell wall biosynthesis